MIKVIGGVVSFNGKLLKVGDKFASTEEHEKRLVEQGFAVYTNELGNGEEVQKQPQPQPKDDEDKGEEFNEEQAKRLTVDKLKEIAIAHGIVEEDLLLEDGRNKTKKEIIELIKSAIAEETEGEDFNELGNGEEGIV